MMETVKTLRAIQFGRKMSVTEPFSAPYFSARVVNGQRPLLRSNAKPSIKIAMIAMSNTQLKVLVMPLYKIYIRHTDIKTNIIV
ncbi:MAG: hypothetical protein V3T79_04555 [Candidatus Scalindua sediminis]